MRLAEAVTVLMISMLAIRSLDRLIFKSAVANEFNRANIVAAEEFGEIEHGKITPGNAWDVWFPG